MSHTWCGLGRALAISYALVPKILTQFSKFKNPVIVVSLLVFFYYLLKTYKSALERTKTKLEKEYLKYTLAGFQNNMPLEKEVRKVQKDPKLLFLLR